jgi:hypothetical protein
VNRMISGVLFASAADSFSEIREWQAIQRHRNHIEINLELLRDAQFSKDMILHFLGKLEAYGLPKNVQVRIHIVPKLIPDGPAGKFRRMYSEVGQPATFSAHAAVTELPILTPVGSAIC